MKIHNKKFLGIVFLVFFTLLILPTSILSIKGYSTRNPFVYEMSFIHAEYLDADIDGAEDDTRFSVNVYFNPEYFSGSQIRLDCLFEIILPSNSTFTFKGYIRFDSVSCVIQFDVYNTVTEPGWYTINFSSYVRIQNIKYTCFCSIIFDPPTGTGEGGGIPTIGLNIG
ncbi:MAG: hypothetical protein KGD59_03630 [Candidatus Heimdallarchaeota archaeon]|nr:hypothetical protein [Candidatus Heimdallarchaeota archaeon]